MTIRQAACLAACAAAVLAASARADDAVPAPCVGAGVLATLAPGSPVPTVVGPSLTAADRQSATADSFLDPATQLTIDHVDVGAAGCAGGAAPGGTATRTTVWRIFGNSLGAATLEADLVPAAGDGSGWRLRSKVAGLEVAAKPVTLEPGQRVAVGTWGVLRSQASFDAGVGQALRFWRAALALELTRGHDGFPAGTTFLIGWVSADRRPAPPPTPPATKPAPRPNPKPKPSRTPPVATTLTTTTTTATTPAVTTTAAPRPAKPHKHPKPKHVRRGFHPSHQPLRATPPLGRGETYVFPLSAQPSWGDTYGAGRSDVPGGWHHGDDLFAKLGTPVIAVANGTVFAIGWNRVGGWRLWLRDSAGNAFYYAHLAGYTALARNNTHVRQGQVLGFVGNTGDAHTTDPHLHFEVHPNGLLYLGYDGAVDPTTYLAGWPRANKVKLLPPVVLPSDAPVGQGSLTDFRRLLALHPLAHPEQLPKLVSRSGPRVALGGQTARSTAVPAGSQSRAPLVAALSLLLLAGAAVGLTAWNGRNR